MKKNKQTKLNKNDSELDVLNSELGSFGLEPPKHYRQERASNQAYKQREYDNPAAHKTPKKRNTSKPEPQLTKEQKMKRHKKKRRLKKKFRIIFSVLALVLALIVIMTVLSFTVLFKTENIEISGSTTYTNEQISSVLPIEKNKSLLLINKSSVSDKLISNLPYIYSVDIKQKLPSTVIVTVNEPSFLYYVKNNDNTYTYFDDTFKVVKINAESPPDKNGIEVQKIALSNPVEGEKAVLTDDSTKNDLSALMAVIDSTYMTEATALYSDGDNENYIVYENRITIKLGDTKNLEDKLYAALASVEKLNTSNPEANGLLTSTGGKQIYFTEQK